MNKQSTFPESLKGLLKGLEILRMFDEKYRKKDLLQPVDSSIICERVLWIQR